MWMWMLMLKLDWIGLYDGSDEVVRSVSPSRLTLRQRALLTDDQSIADHLMSIPYRSEKVIDDEAIEIRKRKNARRRELAVKQMNEQMEATIRKLLTKNDVSEKKGGRGRKKIDRKAKQTRVTIQTDSIPSNNLDKHSYHIVLVHSYCYRCVYVCVLCRNVILIVVSLSAPIWTPLLLQ